MLSHAGECATHDKLVETTTELREVLVAWMSARSHLGALVTRQTRMTPDWMQGIHSIGAPPHTTGTIRPSMRDAPFPVIAIALTGIKRQLWVLVVPMLGLVLGPHGGWRMGRWMNPRVDECKRQVDQLNGLPFVVPFCFCLESCLGCSVQHSTRARCCGS